MSDNVLTLVLLVGVFLLLRNLEKQSEKIVSFGKKTANAYSDWATQTRDKKVKNTAPKLDKRKDGTSGVGAQEPTARRLAVATMCGYWSKLGVVDYDECFNKYGGVQK